MTLIPFSIISPDYSTACLLILQSPSARKILHLCKKIINCTFYYSTDSRCNKYFLKSLFAWTNVFPEYLAQPRTLLEQSSRLSKGSGKFKRYALLSQKQIMNNSKSRDRNLVSASKVSRGFVQMSNSFIDIAFAKMRSSIGSSKPDSSLILFIRSDLSCLRLT